MQKKLKCTVCWSFCIIFRKFTKTTMSSASLHDGGISANLKRNTSAICGTFRSRVSESISRHHVGRIITKGILQARVFINCRNVTWHIFAVSCNNCCFVPGIGFVFLLFFFCFWTGYYSQPPNNLLKKKIFKNNRNSSIGWSFVDIALPVTDLGTERKQCLRIASEFGRAWKKARHTWLVVSTGS